MFQPGISLRYQLQECLAYERNNFNVCHINTQSIPKHYEYLLDCFSLDCVDAILVSESWLKSKHLNGMYGIPGYNFIRNDRDDEFGAGGVSMYLRSDIEYKILSYSTKYCVSEYLFVEITLQIAKIILGVIYCPPRVDYFSELEQILKPFRTNLNIIIMGDFNTNFNRNSGECYELSFIIDSIGLCCLELDSTHRRPNCAETWIDHIFISNLKLVSSYGQMRAPGFSYHDLLYLSYLIKRLR